MSVFFLNYKSLNVTSCITGDQSGSEISTDSSRSVYVSSTGSLILSKVEASMKGSYVCEANNGFGKSLKKTVLISVRGKCLRHILLT